MEHARFLDREWFFGIVILTITFLVAILAPIAGTFALIFAPGVIAYYLARLGRLRGISIVFLALFIGELVGRAMGSSDTVFLAILGIIGLTLHETLKKNLPIERTVLITTGITLTVILVIILAESLISGFSPDVLVERYIMANISESLRLSQHMVSQSEQLAAIKENLPQISRWLMYLAPSILGIGIAFICWLDIILLKPLFSLRGLPFPALGDLTLWKAPDALIWLLIASGFMVLFLPLVGVKLPWVVILGTNGLVVCLFVYFLQGIAVVEFFFRTRRIPQVFRMVFYILLAIQQYFILLVAAAGVLDLWVEWRKPSKRKDPDEGTEE
ncbi:MAG: YybS family protein [Syntrophales bacterium]|nr:YybS family protein [Syntrophales bacterium]